MLTAGVRRVRLGRILADGVPLGPLGATPLECFSSPRGRGMLHGDQACRLLGPEARTVHVELETAPLCKSCAWPLAGAHQACEFALAVARLNTLAVVREPAPNEPAVFAEQAEAVLGWRRAQTQALHAFTAVTAFPWLEAWAEPRLSALTAAVEQARGAAACRVDPDDLLMAACVASQSSPAGLCDVLAATARYPVLDGHGLLLDAWTRWQDACARGEAPVAELLPAATAAVYAAFGSRRKGRDQALDSVQHLVTSSVDQAQLRAERERRLPCREVRVAVPPLEAEPGSTREHDPLTMLQARVLAAHQTAFDCRVGQATLIAPAVVAELLLGG